jgi:hypothetical protein
MRCGRDVHLVVDIALDSIELCLVFHLSDVDEKIHVHPHVVLLLCVRLETPRAAVEDIAAQTADETLVLDVLVRLLTFLSQRLERVYNDAEHDF